MEQHSRAGQVVDDNMIVCIACWITRATNTHLYSVVLIAFPLQQWLHECMSMLHYKYIVCLISFVDLWFD